MKRRLWVLWMAAIWMAVAMPASAEGMLQGRMEAAYEAGRQIEAEAQLALGSGAAMLLPQETVDAIGKLLAEARIAVHWAKGADGEAVMGVRVTVGGAQLVAGEARVANGSVLMTTSWLPGKAVLMPMDNLAGVIEEQPLPIQIDEQTMALLQQSGERYLAVAATWAMANPGLYQPIEEAAPATEARDASVRADTITLGAEPLKDLFVQLADAFAGDTEMQKLIERSVAASGQTTDMAQFATDLAAYAKGLEPLSGGALTLTVYEGADTDPVGVDIQMAPMFRQMSSAGYGQYNRKRADGQDMYGFQGRLSLSDGGMAATKIDYGVRTAGDVTDTQIQLLGMVQNTAEEPISEFTLTDTRQTSATDARETMSDEVVVQSQQLTAEGEPMEGAMALSAAVSTASVAEAVGADGFSSDTTVVLTFMGMELAQVSVAMAPAEGGAADVSGLAVLDLSKATQDEQQQLLTELQAGMAQELMGAMGALPPELLSMMMGG